MGAGFTTIPHTANQDPATGGFGRHERPDRRVGKQRKGNIVSSTLEHVTLTAPDISCGHCEATVKEAVGALAGVGGVRASADTQKVEVDFDPGVVTLPQIESAMAEAGYPVQK